MRTDRGDRAAWRGGVALPALLLALWAGGPGRALAFQAAPPVPAASPPAAGSVDLEARLRAMEEANQALRESLEAMRQSYGTEIQVLRRQVAELGGAAPGVAAGGMPAGGAVASATIGPSSGRTRVDPAAPRYDISAKTAGSLSRLRADFGPGFQLLSEDDEYQLQVHLESQLDYRIFSPPGEEFARSGFVMPRNRIFFTGRMTRGLDYMFSINRGFGNLDILDAWVNFHVLDDRLQIKAGRLMTPFNYEQFAVQNMWLIAPERSLFTSNLGLNRQVGGMAWGYLFDDRMDYALGVFNGPRTSYEDYNDAKDIFSYINLRPFDRGDDESFLHDLNIGGSFVYGAQDNPLVPNSFRVAANASNANTADTYAPPFLQFEPGVRERGDRTFWSAHVAFFRKQLSVLADYNGSILRYSRSRSAPESVPLPTAGYSIAAGYFLTGETVERRTVLVPKRPFSLRAGQRGPGAVELVGRFGTLDVDSSVLTTGLADPELWSNRAWATNIGFNWYLNRYVKVYLDWQHAEFGEPVFYAPDRKQLTNDLFWLRCQLYF